MRSHRYDSLTLVRSGRLIALGVLAAILMSMCLVIPCSASAALPWWHLVTGAQPTNLPPGGEGTITVTAVNLGDAPIDANEHPVTMRDTLPTGLTATSIEGYAGTKGFRGIMTCAKLPELTCTFAGLDPVGSRSAVYPFEQMEVRIKVKIEGAESGEVNKASISGGEARPESVSKGIVVSPTPATFGFEQSQFTLENEEGSPDMQAGSHPFQATASFVLNQNLTNGCHPSTFRIGGIHSCLEPAQLPKDLGAVLPAGLVGNANAVPQCSEAQFTTFAPDGFAECPADTAVGVEGLTLEIESLAYQTIVSPIFNLVPSPGEPARFGFWSGPVPVTLDTAVRTGSDYAVVVTSHNISELPNLLAVRTTLWGVPGDPRHDNARGWSCINGERYIEEYGTGPEGVPPCVAENETKPPAFITLPTSCTGPLQTVTEGDSWKEPANVVSIAPTVPMESLSGCNRVPFSADIETAPDFPEASTPTGLKVDVHVPQETS